MDIINSKDAPEAIGPYSQAVVATGEMVFCSGQIPIDPKTGQICDGSVTEQTQLVMKNLKAVLNTAECGVQDVAKTTIYLSDMNDFGAVNSVYAEAMGDHRPARATVEVSRLPKDVKVEIDCIALRTKRAWI